MKEKTVTVKRYICENCGATHSDKSKIFEDRYTGKEICTKCSKIEGIIPVCIYDEYGVKDFHFEQVYVDKNSAMYPDQELFIHIGKQVRKNYVERINKLNSAYINGNLKNFVENDTDSYEELL